MPRRKKETTVRLVLLTEIVGSHDEVERARATVQAVLDQTSCQIRNTSLSDAPKVPHAG